MARQQESASWPIAAGRRGDIHCQCHSELFDQVLNQREEPAVSSQEVKHVLNQLLTDEDFRSQFQG
ncbi:MAG: hypothetical protein M3Y33_01225, partial [Actinomycetota bacterium]|nr:hypothetical protein [Actinomycetota bacterium]